MSSTSLVPAAAVSAEDSGGNPLPPGDGSFKPGECGKGGTPLAEFLVPDPIVDNPPLNLEPGVRQVYRRRIFGRTSQSRGGSAEDDGLRRHADCASNASLLPVTCYTFQLVLISFKIC